MASYAVRSHEKRLRYEEDYNGQILSFELRQYSPAMKDSVAFPGQTPVIVFFGVLIPRASQKYSKGFESKFGEQ